MPSRAWGGTVTRTPYPLRRNRVQWPNRLEALLEEAPSSCPAWSRICWAPAPGACSRPWARGRPTRRLWLRWPIMAGAPRRNSGANALGACQELDPVCRRLLKAALEELELLEKPMGRLDQEVAELLRSHQDQVQRLAEVPVLGVDSAQPIMAAVGAQNLELSSLNGRHW